ncbi:MAG: archease [Planctomycetia bacterium]|nr:archease [Planctomycetia bacterium]
MFEVFEHTADLGLRVIAPDLETLFVDAARGLFSTIVANLEDVRPVQQIDIHVPGHEREYVLFDWLNELLYTFETSRLVLCQFQVRLTDQGLEGTARGEPLDPARHVLAHEVKAITYHELKVEQTESGWRAEVIVDI